MQILTRYTTSIKEIIYYYSYYLGMSFYFTSEKKSYNVPHGRVA